VSRISKSEVAALGKALSDPNRLSIYIEIAGRSELYVSELRVCRILSNATVSHHLRVLTQAGLVMSRHRGRNIFYRADPAQLIRYCRYLHKLVEPQYSSKALAFTSTLERRLWLLRQSRSLRFAYWSFSGFDGSAHKKPEWSGTTRHHSRGAAEDVLSNCGRSSDSAIFRISCREPSRCKRTANS